MDAKLTQDELQAIKERAEKASAGEWKTDEHRVYSESIDGDYICEIWSSFDDAEFIAASRQDIPKLVTEVERLQRRLDLIDELMLDEFWYKVDDYCEVKPEHSATKGTIQEVTLIAAGAPITGEGDDD